MREIGLLAEHTAFGEAAHICVLGKLMGEGLKEPIATEIAKVKIKMKIII